MSAGYIDVPGGRVWYERLGRGSETPVLTLHGGPGAAHYYIRPFAEELAKTLNDAIQAQATQTGDKKSAAPGAVSDLGQLQGPARVISDKATNKLIIMSSGRDFLALREVIRELVTAHPGLGSQLLTQDGDLNRFVNAFLNDTDVRHLQALETPVGEGDTLVLLPAMAGG